MSCIIRNGNYCTAGGTYWHCLNHVDREPGMKGALIASWGSRFLLHMKVGPPQIRQAKDPHPTQTINLKRNLAALQEWGMSIEGLEKMKLKPNVAELSAGAFKSKLCWLMDFFGFSKLQVVRIIRSYPSLLGLSMDENVRPFMQLLRSEGLSSAEIRKTVLYQPETLGRAKKFSFLEKSLEDNLQITRPQAVALIAKCPRILLKESLGVQIKNMVEVLTGLGIVVDKVSLMVRKFPELLLMSPEEDLQPYVEQCRGLGLSAEDASSVLSEAPSLLGKDFNKYVYEKLVFLTKEAGFDHIEALQLLVQDPRKFRDSLAIWRNTHRWMLERGMDLETAKAFIQKNMSFLSRNCRGLDEKYQFAVEILGKQSQEIIRCPRYFNASFEDIILFRAAFLQKKGEDCSQRALGHMVASNGIFNKRHGYDDIEEFRKTWMQLSKSQKLAQIDR